MVFGRVRSQTLIRESAEYQYQKSRSFKSEIADMENSYAWRRPMRAVGLNLPSTPLKFGSRCLKFIHIPKTAGSAVEIVGKRFKRAKITWGFSDRRFLRCTNQTICVHTMEFMPRKCCGPKWPITKFSCSLWHYPPSADPLLATIYATCATFCVVRDPIRRFLSEYFWFQDCGFDRARKSQGKFQGLRCVNLAHVARFCSQDHES